MNISLTKKFCHLFFFFFFLVTKKGEKCHQPVSSYFLSYLYK